MSSASLCSELNRLNTFKNNWPHLDISKEILAKNGFVFVGPYDLTKCHFCSILLSNWEAGDDVVKKHTRWSPKCPLINNCAISNIPMKSPSELDRISPISYDVCGIFSDGPMTTSKEHNGNVRFPEFANIKTRLFSFADWPKALKQTPKELNEAGFFYSKRGDGVTCFSCGGSLRDWDDHDNVWEQHALWYNGCNFIKSIKGQNFIDEIKGKESEKNKTLKLPGQKNDKEKNNAEKNNTQLSTSTTPTINEKDDENLFYARLCKICFKERWNTMFIPCGHTIACTECASGMNGCTSCRKKFTHILKRDF